MHVCRSYPCLDLPRLGCLWLPPNPPPLLHGTAEAAAAPVLAIFLHCSCVCQNEKKEHHSFQSITIDDGGEAFLLMNRNLPIYMHCPHCKNLERKGTSKFKVCWCSVSASTYFYYYT